MDPDCAWMTVPSSVRERPEKLEDAISMSAALDIVMSDDVRSMEADERVGAMLTERSLNIPPEI